MQMSISGIDSTTDLVLPINQNHYIFHYFYIVKMAGVQFYPLDVRMRTVGQRPVITLYGRTVTGERIAVTDSNYFPYFYVVPRHGTEAIEQDLMKIRVKVNDEIHSIVKVEKKKVRIFEKEKNVLKCYVSSVFGGSYLSDEIKKMDILGIYEHDVPLIASYMIDRRLVPCALTIAEGEITNPSSKLPVLRADSLVQEEEQMIKPKVLAFDIETYSPKEKSASPESDPVLMISFYSDDYKKTILWNEFQTDDKSIEFVKSEFELLSAFKRIIDEFQPDILVGYASDIYSFPYLKKRAEKYGLKFDIGVDKTIADISNSETSIKGIIHVDVYKFISRIMASKLETDTFRLEDVSLELTGEGKKQVDISRLPEVWDSSGDLGQFCDYNLNDAYLTYKIFEKIFPSLAEYVKLTNLDIFDVSRGSFSQFAESFLIKESKFFNELIPSKPNSYENREVLHSGPIIEPEQGVYSSIAVFDFKSLHPSITATHNISAGSLKCSCCSENVPGEDVHFCSKISGFIPKLTGNLIDRRERISEILKAEDKSFEQKMQLSARYDAINSIASSIYGAFSLPYSRWHNAECSRAIASYGRYYLNYAVDKAKNEKFDVLYADNDVIFIRLGSKKQEQARKFLDELNASLPEKMNLDYEGFYPRGMFVASKTGKETRRRYALLSENGLLKIRGLESAKRNFSTIARETQEKVLELILKERKLRKALEHVKGVISDVMENKVPLRKMMIYTQLSREISSYETIAPHVAVAQKMQKQGFNVIPGSIIRYIVGKGEGSIADNSQLPNEVKEYDADYYVEHQIIPSVEKIFEAAGVDFRNALDEKEQSSLSEFI